MIGAKALVFTLLLAAASAGSATQTLRGSREAQQGATTARHWELIANRLYLQEWEAPRHVGIVEMSLYYCGHGCGQNECGEWIRWLCPDVRQNFYFCHNDREGYDSGAYTFTLPEPLEGTDVDDFYKIGFAHSLDASSLECSDAFRLLSSSGLKRERDAALEPISSNDLYWAVTVSSEGHAVSAGEIVRIQFDADSTAADLIPGEVTMNLYMADGRSHCGVWLSALYDEGMGTFGPSGTYDVTIPRITPAGFYSIGVAPVGSDDAPVTCSRAFEVIVDDAAELEYYEIDPSIVTDDNAALEYLEVGSNHVTFGSPEATASKRGEGDYGSEEEEVAQDAAWAAEELGKVLGAEIE